MLLLVLAQADHSWIERGAPQFPTIAAAIVLPMLFSKSWPLQGRPAICGVVRRSRWPVRGPCARSASVSAAPGVGQRCRPARATKRSNWVLALSTLIATGSTAYVWHHFSGDTPLPFEVKEEPPVPVARCHCLASICLPEQPIVTGCPSGTSTSPRPSSPPPGRGFLRAAPGGIAATTLDGFRAQGGKTGQGHGWFRVLPVE
jgi:hypothetical protein